MDSRASFVRAFFAVDLPVAYQQRLNDLIEALKRHLKRALKTSASVRWVRAGNLHLTLQFLGQINEDEAAALLRRESQALAGIQAFQMKWGPLEWFPTSHDPRVLSLQAGPEAALAALSQALGRGALEQGYALEDRPFRGHVTLARIEGLQNLPGDLLTSFSWEALPPLLVNKVVFFRSDPWEGGSIYTPLASLVLESAEILTGADKL